MPVIHSSLPTITDADFDAAVAPGTGVVAVDFTADWCPPCRMMAPILDQAARDLAGKVRFAQVDSDANPRSTIKYGVRGLPTLLVFKDGEVAARITGAVPMSTLRERLAQVHD